MTVAHVNVPDNVREILLHETEIRGDRVKIVRQLDRPAYVAVNKVLTSIGGKWNSGAGAFVFKDAQRGLDRLHDVLSGKPVVDTKKTFQEFFTPDALADELIGYVDLEDGNRVLEPSAGNGQLIRAARRANSSLFVHAVDMNPDHVEALKREANSFSLEDFINATPAVLGTFDRVIMNPPFNNGQDAAHVVHAFGFLRQGGILASIISQAFRFRTDRRYPALRDLVDSHGVLDVNVPMGAFKESGTNIPTTIVVLRK